MANLRELKMDVPKKQNKSSLLLQKLVILSWLKWTAGIFSGGSALKKEKHLNYIVLRENIHYLE